MIGRGFNADTDLVLPSLVLVTVTVHSSPIEAYMNTLPFIFIVRVRNIIMSQH